MLNHSPKTLPLVSTRTTSEKSRRTKKEKKVNFSSINNEKYNRPFTVDELLDSLSNSNDSAAGPDGIYYKFLTHLPVRCTATLLKKIYNDIWSNSRIPSSWREATVVVIPKPGRDHTDPSNYRPIAQTSCLCKTIEIMVNGRLVLHL